ncbi:protein FAM185A-like [Anneissia japonica]|uniref:protein FAM185A-like n=1 Tax=Anneissia japonica TaxID=1529436 RepID=UPI0014254F68|nr:protein FAM185A-like [Anneissia japonica]
MHRLYRIIKHSKPSVMIADHRCGYGSTQTRPRPSWDLSRPRLCRQRVAASYVMPQEKLHQSPVNFSHMLRPGLSNISSRTVGERSYTTTSTETADNDQTAKIRSWAFELNNSFGKIISNTSFPMRVVPLNPIEFPSSDRIFVHLLLRSPISGDKLSNFIKHTFKESCSADVSLNDDHVLAIEGGFLNEEQVQNFDNNSLILGWYVEIPMSFDLHLKTTGLGHVCVEKFENQNCDLETERGDCVMKSLKTGQVTASTQGGSIVSVKSLLGNVSLTTRGEGEIKTGKIQGHVVKLTSEDGTITCSDIYANATTMQSESGDIITGNLHGECNLKSKEGNIKIGSLDGSLHSELTRGSLDVYAIRHKDIYINNSEGDIVVKVPNELKTYVELDGREITIPDKPQFADCTREQIEGKMKVTGVISHCANSNKIYAKADNGKIKIKTLSWFDSLSFHNIMKEV